MGGNGGIDGTEATPGQPGGGGGGDIGGTMVGGCAIANVPAAASIPEIKINLRT
jgi:hypothetical protein